MTFFQRIRTPFTEGAADDQARMQPRTRLVGESLQERREDLGLDLDEIGAMLRIKPAYLAALEQGRSHDLPGPAYAIGFVRAYADFLGLDADKVLERFKAEAAGITARPDLALPAPLGERSLPGGALVLVALILALCGYGIWYYLSTEERSRPDRVAAVPASLQPSTSPVLVAPPVPGSAPPPGPTPAPAAAPAAGTPPPPGLFGAAANPNASAAPPPAPTAPSQPGPVAATPPAAPASPTNPNVRPAVAPTQTAAATPSPTPNARVTAVPVQPPAAAPTPASPNARTAAAPPAPTQAAPAAATPPAANAAAQGSRISIRALSDCWIQVRASDQSIVFSRVLKSGEIYKVPARAGLSLRTGNAGALEIAVDGKMAPSIGSAGTLRRDVVLDPAALVSGTAVHG